MDKLGVGIVGSGTISTTYLELAPLFRALEMRAVSDIVPEVARMRAEQYGVRAMSVEDLLAAPDIDMVVNLTVPNAHFEISRRILEAGKHAYSEKPLVLTADEGKALRDLADAKGLRIGSAPDTFLGGAHQLARAAIDEGEIGRIVGGTAHVMSHGMEHWHPNPDFFFQPGGGPMLDLGPYYITNLVQLLGPVLRVAALTSATFPTRTIGSGPREGEVVPVDTPTNIHSLLEFKSGAIVTLGTSWDVWAHGHSPMEIYGETGTLTVPDPNFFGGPVGIMRADGTSGTMKVRGHPFGRVNQQLDGPTPRANYRCAGLADMADAIVTGRKQRCDIDLALHVVEVMTGALQSGEERSFVEMTTTCERPAALSPDEALELLV